MAFVTVSTTASSAIATNGTFTVSAPTATLAGAIKYNAGHVMIVRGMQTVFVYGTDFSISWSGITATVTYLGTTTIPINSVISMQFELAGEDTNYPYHGKASNLLDYTRAYRGSFGQVFRVDFGAPLAASTTAVLATTAVTATTANTLTTAYTCDVPRALQCTSSGSDSAVITIKGYDEYGTALTESFTLSDVSVISGKKAWKTVVSYTASAAMANNLSIGILSILGLPYYLPALNGTGIGSIVRECQDGALATAGTAVGGVLTKATAATGDVRGTITPNTSPDGSKTYQVFMFVPDPTNIGVAQFGT